MKCISLFVVLFVFSSCVSQPSLKNSLLDASTVGPPASKVEFPELRLGDFRYSKGRLTEREAISWYYLPDGTFRSGVPREDQDAYESVKARIFEVAVAERGKYKGYALERWDIMAESVPAAGAPTVRQFHQYFLRSNTDLVYLPALAKGAVGPFWGRADKAVPSYLQQRWDLTLRVDPRYSVPELRLAKQVTVPGEGAFRVAPAGESLAATEVRLGGATNLASLPAGREVFRVPGDWMVFVYPDGLAVTLEKAN